MVTASRGRSIIWLNLLALLGYGMLYFLFSREGWEGFPVQFAVYFSVHGLGLMILSIVQRVLRNRALTRSFLLSGFLVFGLGWIFVFTFCT